MTSPYERISFHNGSIEVVGNIYFPNDLAADTTYPAIVLSTPGSSVKEQIGANYAERLAAKGYLALAFGRLPNVRTLQMYRDADCTERAFRPW